MLQHSKPARAPAAIPSRAGIGLKPEHYADLAGTPDRVAFLEIHAENYMGAGGAPHHHLTRLRERYPISLHGVGLSIGGEGPLDRGHLRKLRAVADRYEPGLFSEHLAWSTHNNHYLADLLPISYDAATLQRVCDHIDEVQEAMGLRMLLENPSTYVAFDSATLSEIEFLKAVVARCGCGLLLDVNNVHVSAINHGRDALAYLNEFPVEHVGEIHLGGYDEDVDGDGARLLIDAHGSPVADVVWSLFRAAIGRTGPVPTLIEWDNNVPDFATLAGEAERADAVLREEAARRNSVRAAAGFA